jgi:hypothetical protein
LVLVGVTSPFTEPVARAAWELGRLIGDPERPLPGEDPRTSDPSEARHWATVHAELLDLRLDLLRQLLQSAQRVRDPLVASGLRLNVQGLELSVNRSRTRAAFWARRLGELVGSFADSSPG